MKTPEEVSYLLKRGYHHRLLDALDDRISLHFRMDNCFMAGFYTGSLYRMEMQEWYRLGCKGPEPKEARTSDFYLVRHLTKQFKRIARRYVR